MAKWSQITCAPSEELATTHEAMEAYLDKLAEDESVPPSVRACAALAASMAHDMLQSLGSEAEITFYGQAALARKEAFDTLVDALAERFLAGARRFRAHPTHATVRPYRVEGPTETQ